MTLYLEPKPLVYETKFSEDCHLCIGGGIAIEGSQFGGAELNSYLRGLGEPYKRAYDLQFDGDTMEREDRISFLCLLKPVADVVIDRRSADEDRIPEWLSYLINLSKEKNLEKIIVDADISTLNQIKTKLGLKTEYFFMARLGDKFEIEKQEDALIEMIQYGVSCVTSGNSPLPEVVGHSSRHVLSISGKIRKVVFS
jgi:hypothetical protein